MSLQTSKLPRLSNSYWKSMENRKNFLDEIAKKLNIKIPNDWGKITWKKFHEAGGGSILNYYYKGSLFRCLQSIYKDINWKREWFGRLPRSNWKSIENRKNFLDKMAKKLDIKTPNDWGKVTVLQFNELGGYGMLNYYDGSIFTCLQSIYKEWFVNLPNSYWKSMENRKNFLDEVAKKLNIKIPSDWGKITVHRFRDLGGSGILHYYQDSIFACLQSVYKDINWKREWFLNLPKVPRAHWNSMENRKNFLDEIAKKLNIKTPSDWGKITLQQFYTHGGNSLLRNCNGSLFTCLQSVYKDINWQKEWFINPTRLPNTYWKSMENRRNFLHEVATVLKIKSPSDWGSVTLSQIRGLGGSGILQYYNSVFDCLKSVYKDINWKRSWFRSSVRKFPKSHFRSFENQLEFFDNLARQYNLQDHSGWKAISINLIKKHGGGPLLARYNNSISNALNTIYPSMNSLLIQNASNQQIRATDIIQKFGTGAFKDMSL